MRTAIAVPLCGLTTKVTRVCSFKLLNFVFTHICEILLLRKSIMRTPKMN